MLPKYPMYFDIEYFTVNHLAHIFYYHPLLQKYYFTVNIFF